MGSLALRDERDADDVLRVVSGDDRVYAITCSISPIYRACRPMHVASIALPHACFGIFKVCFEALGTRILCLMDRGGKHAYVRQPSWELLVLSRSVSAQDGSAGELGCYFALQSQ
jgi:hypothetical protein